MERSLDDLADLTRQLQDAAGGANIHTANKAVMYLQHFQMHGDTIKYLALKRLAERALKGDWLALKLHMQKWW